MKMAHRNSFNFTGTLIPKKDGKQEITSKTSQWAGVKLNFGLLGDGSYQPLTIQSQKVSENSPLYYFNTKKEKKSILFKDRASVNLDDVAPYTLYILDLNTYSKKQLEYFAKNLDVAEKNGLNETKINELLAVYEEKRKKFISQSDFLQAVEELINNPAYKDQKFNVGGDVLLNKGEGVVFTTYQVRKIKATQSDEQVFTNMNFLISQDSLDELEEDGSFLVNGYTVGYDTKTKGDAYYPYTIRVMKVKKDKPEDEERATAILRKRFTVKGEKLKECVIVSKAVNETSYRPITEEDLSEEELDAIFLGETTLEELQREYKPIAGATVRENRFVKMGVGYTRGAVETELTLDDILGTSTKKDEDEENEEDYDDLFED